MPVLRQCSCGPADGQFCSSLLPQLVCGGGTSAGLLHKDVPLILVPAAATASLNMLNAKVGASCALRCLLPCFLSQSANYISTRCF